jgi:hypothetical protein
LRRSFGGGTGRTGRSESGHDDDDDDEAWGGSMGMKEKEVGVVLDCNTGGGANISFGELFVNVFVHGF